MKCTNCGGHVEWRGPLVNLTHTECSSCGGINCQEVEAEPVEVCCYCHREECGCSDFDVSSEMGDK